MTVARYKTPVRGADIAVSPSLCDRNCAKGTFPVMVSQIWSCMLHFIIDPSGESFLKPCSFYPTTSLCIHRLNRAFSGWVLMAFNAFRECACPASQGMHEIDKVGITPDTACGPPRPRAH